MADLDNREGYEEEMLALILLLWASDDVFFWLNRDPSIRFFSDRIRNNGLSTLANKIARQQTNSFLDEIEWYRERERLTAGLDILGERFETSLSRRLAHHHQEFQDAVAIAERDGTAMPSIDSIYETWEAKREAVTSISQLVSGAEMRGKDRLKNLYGVEVASYWQLDPLSNWCQVCLNLANTPERIWSLEFPDGPPSHPNCRCFLQNTRILSNEAA